MPLVLVSGYPSAGKTHRARQLLGFFHDSIAQLAPTDARAARLKVHYVSDQTLGLHRRVYHSARTEKDARAAQVSAVKRVLGRDDIVIADGMNYIKGFRYQLYCEAKAMQTPSCVVHVGTPVDTCRTINQQLLANPSVDGGYDEDDFENLILRYEEPNGMARWDSPLFTVVYEDETPPFQRIWDAVVGGGDKAKAVRPNAATVLTPAAESDHLYELDKSTSEIVSHIVSWQNDHPGAEGGLVAIAGAEHAVVLPASVVSLPQLQRIRRQFIALNRQHNLSKPRVRHLFVDYLNDVLQAT